MRMIAEETISGPVDTVRIEINHTIFKKIVLRHYCRPVTFLFINLQRPHIADDI